MSKKVKKVKVKKEVKKEVKKMPEPEPTPKVDINTEIYRDLFKFLEEKVSLECFIDMHGQCFGKANCQCECHKK